MADLAVTEIVPIETDADGVIRVSKTRDPLDTIIMAFNDGATPEEITQQYPSVPLTDVYSVIGYYLRRSSDVNAYLNRRQQQSEQVQKENEIRFNPVGVRERLIARRAGKIV